MWICTVGGDDLDLCQGVTRRTIFQSTWIRAKELDGCSYYSTVARPLCRASHHVALHLCFWYWLRRQFTQGGQG